MKVVVTGAEGFLGRHLQARLRANGSHQVVTLGREAFADDVTLEVAVKGSDVIVHLAGINRGDADSLEAGNQQLAERLTSALDGIDHSTPIVFANSIQAGQNSPYGRGKQRAADALANWADKRDTGLVNIVYQNLFGESGRPDYNSFVATFCQRLATGGEPEILTDRSVELIHGQAAAQIVIDQLERLAVSTTVMTSGVHTTVGEVGVRLGDIAATYAGGRLPDLADQFTLDLFNTYRSYLYPEFYPYQLSVKWDARGGFVEAVQSSGGPSQVSFSTTAPGVTRGEHFHLRKVERFLVVKGTGRIAVRPVYGTDIDVFDVSGDDPTFIDMPTLHTHNITNVGTDPLYTLFWTNEVYDPDDSDTFRELVE